MKVAKIAYRDWPDAYRCTLDSLELIIVTAIGPRIMSLRFLGEENVLYEDQTNFSVGDWQLYGGHRLAVAPEGFASYLPDGDPCDCTVQGEELTIRQRPNSIGLLKSLHVKKSGNGRGFEISHHIENVGCKPWSGALWAITCIKSQGRILLPWKIGQQAHDKGGANYWTGTNGTYIDHTHRQWQPAVDHYVVEPTGEKGKVGMFNERVWMALLRDDLTFIKSCGAASAANDYPHGGCNLEVFTCPHYVELETLGPQIVLNPGETQLHVEQWQLVKNVFAPKQWNLIEQMAALPATKFARKNGNTLPFRPTA